MQRRRRRLLVARVNERQQRLGQAGQVPLRDRGLVAVGVAAAMVDRAEHRLRVVGVHERARAVVDRLPGDRHVVGVHHAVDEPDEHPPRDERRPGASATASSSATAGSSAAADRRVVAVDRVVGQAPQETRGRVAGRDVLEGPDPQVAGGDARQDGAGQRDVSR